MSSEQEKCRTASNAARGGRLPVPHTGERVTKGKAVKCFEVRGCTDKERESCFVWINLRENPEDFERIKCWVLKGVYQEENREQLESCRRCKYYLMMNEEGGVISDIHTDVGIIHCDGVINNDRSKALEKVWESLRENGKTNVLLDLSRINNVYSCGLGVILKMHKETRACGGILVVLCAAGYVRQLFEATKLTRILRIVADAREAEAVFEEIRREKEPSTDAGEQTSAEARQRVPCWEFWGNRNPRNATPCDECFRKRNAVEQPCWIVEGVMEGVKFQYVNEECEECAYFLKFQRSKQ